MVNKLRKTNRILVTGASGCVGSNLVRRLCEDPKNDITILIPKNTWHPFLTGLRIRIFYGDIRSERDVRKAMEGIDYLYQVAGVVSYNKLDDKNVFSTHVYGVHNMLTIAKEFGVKKVVVTASTAGIGMPEDKTPLDENAPFDFKKYKKVMYNYSKYLTIQICKKFAKEGLNVSICSPTTIYGPGDITMHIGKVVKKIKEEKLTYAPRGGNAVVSTEDVTDAHILIMKKGKSGENYIVANECMDYIKLFNIIADLLGKKKIKKKLPSYFLTVIRPLVALLEKVMLFFKMKPILSPASLNFSFKFRYFDSLKIRTELNWEPKINFRQAMSDAIDFYRKHKLI